MIHTIPAVSRTAGSGRWISSSVVYALASTAGGIVIGAIVGVLGTQLTIWLTPNIALMVVAIATCLMGMVDLRLVRVPRIQRKAQVPEPWRWRFPPEVSSALYGMMLGTGVLTRIPFASFYAVLVWALLVGNIGASVTILGVYAFFRALPQLFLTPFLRDSDTAISLSSKLVGRRSAVSNLGGVLMMLIGVFVGIDML